MNRQSDVCAYPVGRQQMGEDGAGKVGLRAHVDKENTPLRMLLGVLHGCLERHGGLPTPPLLVQKTQVSTFFPKLGVAMMPSKSWPRRQAAARLLLMRELVCEECPARGRHAAPSRSRSQEQPCWGYTEARL